MGVGELGKDTVDKGVVPTSGSSGNIPKVEGGKRQREQRCLARGDQDEEVKRRTGRGGDEGSVLPVRRQPGDSPVGG